MSDRQLIELVKAHEAVYNTKSMDYRDARLRTAAWDDISRMHGKPVEECKENWNKLRNCFSNAIKRRMRKSDRHFPPWRFEKQMSFLIEHIESRIKRYENSYCEDSIASPASIEHHTISPEPDMKVEYLDLENTPNSDNEMRPSSYKRKSSPAREISMVELINNSQEVKGNDQEFDDVDQFFLCMSKMVKKLPRMDQIQIKLDLHTAICKAEIKQYEKEDHN